MTLILDTLILTYNLRNAEMNLNGFIHLILFHLNFLFLIKLHNLLIELKMILLIFYFCVSTSVNIIYS